MIARFFINKDKLSYFLLPVFAVIVHVFIVSFADLEYLKEKNDSFILSFLAFKTSTPFLFIVNLLLSVTNSFLVSYLCSKHEITDKQNQLPAFFYILFSSVLTISGGLNPLLPGFTLLILALNKLFNSYREDNSFVSIFDSCFLLSLAILFYSPLIIFVFIPFIGLLLMKPFKLNEWIAGVFGVICPFFVTSMLLYLLNEDFFKYLDYLTLKANHAHSFVFMKGSFLIHSAVFIVGILSVFFVYNRINNFKIKTQKIIHLFLWMMSLGIIGVFITGENNFFFCSLFIVPMSIYIGHYIGSLKKNGMREFLTLMILIAYICSNLQVFGVL